MGPVLMWLGLYDEMYTHGFGASSRRLVRDLVIYLLNTPLVSWLAVRLSPFEGTATPFAVGTGICWILISADLIMSWHNKHVHLTVICLALTLLLSPSDVTTTPFILAASIRSIFGLLLGIADSFHAKTHFTVSAVCFGVALLLLVSGVTTTILFAVSTVIVLIASFAVGIKDPDHAKMHFTASAVCLGLVALRVLYNTTVITLLASNPGVQYFVWAVLSGLVGVGPVFIVAFALGIADSFQFFHAKTPFGVSVVCFGVALLLLVSGVTTIPFAVSAGIVLIVSFGLGITDPNHAGMHFMTSAVCLGLAALWVLFNTTAVLSFDPTLVCVRHASMRATADVLVLNVKS